VEVEMFRNKEQYREHLEGLPYEDLLGEDFLNDEADAEIDRRLDVVQSDLESMDYEDLLGHDRLEDLAEAEIERRWAAFEEAHDE
jgi:hypothetical protein